MLNLRIGVPFLSAGQQPRPHAERPVREDGVVAGGQQGEVLPHILACHVGVRLVCRELGLLAKYQYLC